MIGGSTPTTALRAWWSRYRRPALLAAAVAAGGMSVLWFLVVPDAVEAAAGWRAAALLLGHGACWALLAASLLTGAADGPARLRAGLAWAALAAYAAFLLALVTA